jgi:hypothetical protein
MSGIRRATLMPQLLPLLLPLLLLGACARAPEPPEHVTHEERALAKANAAWADAYNQRADEAYSPGNVRRFAPYRVTLNKGIWTVRTSAGTDLHGRAPTAVIIAGDGTTYVASIER